MGKHLKKCCRMSPVPALWLYYSIRYEFLKIKKCDNFGQIGDFSFLNRCGTYRLPTIGIFLHAFFRHAPWYWGTPCKVSSYAIFIGLKPIPVEPCNSLLFRLLSCCLFTFLNFFACFLAIVSACPFTHVLSVNVVNNMLD